MTELCIGDQQICVDREATVIAYSEIRQGDADRCGCTAAGILLCFGSKPTQLCFAIS